MNGYEFRTKLAEIAPDYTVDQDQEGQIVIYTGLKNDGADNYVPLVGALCGSCEAPIKSGSGEWCHDCENQAGLCVDCGVVVEDENADPLNAYCSTCKAGA